jgi:hypothetical protein
VELLFQFTVSELKLELAYRFLEFLGVTLPRRKSSKDSYNQQRIQYTEEIRDIFNVLSGKYSSWEYEREITDPSMISFIRGVFSLMSKVYPADMYLPLAYIMFEGKHDIENARKLAKSLLFNQRMNLVLWNGYAQLEKKSSKLDDARKVYSTALSTQHSLPPEFKAEAPLLFRSYAELELGICFMLLLMLIVVKSKGIMLQHCIYC